jgi:hypothetical protein
MAKYRKKPVVIEAVQFCNDSSSYNLIGWTNNHQYGLGRPLVRWVNDTLIVPTLEGEMLANVGDWIICGIKGELYPIKDDIFRETYEAVQP